MQVGGNINDRARDAKYFDERAFRSNSAGDKKDGTLKETGVGGEETVDFRKMLREKKGEIFKKVINGETEPKIQIGAQAFTDKEWDRLLKQFDSSENTAKNKFFADKFVLSPKFAGVDSMGDPVEEKMREEYAKRFKRQVGQAKECDSEEEKKGPLSDSDSDIEELLRQIL